MTQKENSWEEECELHFGGLEYVDGKLVPQRVDIEKIKSFITNLFFQARRDGYDEGAMEASIVCNEKTIPQAVREERQKVVEWAENIQDKWDGEDGIEIEKTAEKFGVPVSVMAQRLFSIDLDDLLTNLKNK